jgi:hypothetical protein
VRRRDGCEALYGVAGWHYHKDRVAPVSWLQGWGTDKNIQGMSVPSWQEWQGMDVC